MPSYTQTLLELNAKIDQLVATAGCQEDILITVREINGFVRKHGETLAAHSQWLESHEQEHEKSEKEMRTLSGRLWALGGGGGLLGLIATILQLLDLRIRR